MKRITAVSILFVAFCLVFTGVMPASASTTGVQTGMIHNPHEYFVATYRIQLDVLVSDPAGVDLVRCYFRAVGEADFVFVPMTKTGGSNKGDYYSGVLPAPSQSTGQLEYLFLAVNDKKSVVKSQSFILKQEIKDKIPAWQSAGEGEIRISMELDNIPSQLPGFTDNIVMNQVESGVRFGLVAGGLYHLTENKTASVAGKAAESSAAGVISAKSAGYSTAFIVGASAAAVGVTAAALSGGGGGGGGGGNYDPNGPVSDKSLVGNWHVTDSQRPGWYMDASLKKNGTMTATEYIPELNQSGSGGGNWTFNDSTDYFVMNSTLGAKVMDGYISGSANNFYVDGQYYLYDMTGTIVGTKTATFHWVKQ